MQFESALRFRRVKLTGSVRGGQNALHHSAEEDARSSRRYASEAEAVEDRPLPGYALHSPVLAEEAEDRPCFGEATFSLNRPEVRRASQFHTTQYRQIRKCGRRAGFRMGSHTPRKSKASHPLKVAHPEQISNL